MFCIAQQHHYENVQTVIRSIGKNPELEIVQQSVKVDLHIHVQRECSAEPLTQKHPVSLRIFASLPGSHLRFFIAMQIQYTYEHIFVQQQAPMRKTLCSKL